MSSLAKRAVEKLWRVGLGLVHNQMPMARAPRGLKPRVIGRSVEERGVECFTVGKGPRGVVLAANMHGNEVGSQRFVRRFLAWLPGQPNLLERYTFHVVPCLNPDGYTLARRKPNYLHDGRIGRFNGNNVDLNRNFPVPSHQPEGHWNWGRNYAGRTPVFCGEKGGSEPEMQALVKLFEETGADTLVMCHNAGRDIMASKDDWSQKAAEVFAAASGFGHYPRERWPELEQAGTALEWCEQEGLHYLELEGSYRWGSDWHRQKAGLVAALHVD